MMTLRDFDVEKITRPKQYTELKITAGSRVLATDFLETKKILEEY